MLIRITILNIFNRIDLIEQKQIIHLVRLENCSPKALIAMGRGEVVYRHTSLYSDVIWNNMRMIRMRTKHFFFFTNPDSYSLKNVNLTKLI
jgi:hypothetical protein